MADKKPFYITTTLPYVNAEPHIGFAMEIIHADIIARWKKSQGHDVFFNTGTDEHGQKVLRAAQKEDKDVQKYVNEYSEKFRTLKDKLGLDEETLHFIRTTDDKHIQAAQSIWARCFDKGDIYKKKYKGLYCVGDEAFVKPSDLVEGRCPNHPNLELEEIEEENYYFKLTNYKDQILKHAVKSIIPDQRLAQLKDILDNLDDISISRDKSRLSWGIPVPGDDTQVMYVWFDALTSYISTLGWPGGDNFKKFWEEGETLQLAGKDQVKFQSIIWQAMLLSAGLPLTKRILYHGFVKSQGQKMSKSLGNVISPSMLIERYGLEPTRAMLAGVNQYEDTDINIEIENEGFDLTYSGNFVNGLGNLVARIMKLAEDHRVTPLIMNNPIPEAFSSLLDQYEIKNAVEEIWHKVKKIDQKITKEEPFKVIKTDPVLGKTIIQEVETELYDVARMIGPIMPRTSEIIIDSIKNCKKPDNLFPRLA